MSRKDIDVDIRSPRNPDEWEPPGFGAALSGHLVLGVVKAPGVLLVLWVLTHLDMAPSLRLGGMVAGVVAATGVAALVEVPVEDRFARARKLSSPGGWDFALVPALVALPVVVLLGWLVGRSFAAGLALGVAWAIVEACEIAWLRPWEPGMTQAEHDAKWMELKDMTRETFVPDVAEIRRRAAERSMQRYRDAIARKQRDAADEEGERF